MKKSINVKDFIQMMPSVSQKLAQSRNSNYGEESPCSSYWNQQNFLSTIQRKNRKKKLSESYDLTQHHRPTLTSKQAQQLQKSEMQQWLQDEQMVRKQKNKQFSLRKQKTPKQQYKAAEVKQFHIDVYNKELETINTEELVRMGNDDKKKLNPFQLNLRKKNLIRMKVKLNSLSVSTQLLGEGLRHRKRLSIREKCTLNIPHKKRYETCNNMEKTLNLTPESRTLKSRTVPIRIKKPLVLKKVEKAEAEQIT